MILAVFFIATYVVRRKALTGFKPDLCDAGAVPFHAVELSSQLGAGRYNISVAIKKLRAEDHPQFKYMAFMFHV